METMHERIKRMTKEEMSEFIYLVYLCGNKDGRDNLCDSPYASYFGGHVLTLNANRLMPNDKIDDLYDSWELN